MTIDRTGIFKSMSWRLFERIGAQAAAFIVNIIVARILSPEDYGVVAIATVMIAILDAVGDGGIKSALIQKDQVDSTDYSSAFFFRLGTGTFMYVILFFSAPYIAAFYRNGELVRIIRILSLMLLTSVLRTVPEAHVIRNLQMKIFFFSTLIGTVVSAVAGIWMAFHGYGVWALVAQHLINTSLDSMVLFLASKWHLTAEFSIPSIKALHRFGWKIMVTSLVGTIYDNLRQLLIGKYHSASSLGYYNKGEQLPNIVTLNINAPLQTVLFPALSSSQNDTVKMRSMLQHSIEVCAYCMAPLMGGLAMIAPQAVRFLLTDKWLPCVPFIRVFCLIYFFFPLHECNQNAVKALGKGGLYLRTELIKKGIGLLLLLFTIRVSAWAVCLSLIPYTVSMYIINGYLSGSLLDYGILAQLKSLISPILLMLAMCACIFPVSLLGFSDPITIFLQVLLGAAVYISGSIILKLKSFRYLADIGSSLVRKR